MFGNLSDTAKSALGDLVKSNGGNAEEVSPVESSIELGSDVAEEQDSTVAGMELEGNSEPEQEDELASDTLDSEGEADETSPDDIEYVTAYGKKIKIDYNNRDHIKNVYSLAAMARPMTAERDEWKSKYESLNGKHGELEKLWNTLEDVKDDPNALFERITGGQSLDDIVEERLKERDSIASMTPSQLEAYRESKELQTRMKEIDKRTSALDEREKQLETKRDTADRTSQQALVNPAFNKYRFSGQLGDADSEYEVDSMLWERAINKLNEHENVTPELIDDTFRKSADSMRKFIKTQASKQTKKTIRKEKVVAKKKAQKAAAPSKSDFIKDSPLLSSLSNILRNK